MENKGKREILDRIKKSRSWKETGLSLEEVYDAFSGDSSHVDGDYDKSYGEANEEAYSALKIACEQNEATIRELQGKITRLTDTNKQLRAENKSLKNGGQNA